MIQYEKKDQRIDLRVTTSEKIAIYEAARNRDLSVTDYIINACWCYGRNINKEENNNGNKETS